MRNERCPTRNHQQHVPDLGTTRSSRYIGTAPNQISTFRGERIGHTSTGTGVPHSQPSAPGRGRWHKLWSFFPHSAQIVVSAHVSGFVPLLLNTPSTSSETRLYSLTRRSRHPRRLFKK